MSMPLNSIAVLIPCYNEAATIDKVVADFRRVLPEAQVYVYDNCSSDETAEKAQRAGAIVRHEPRQGKGNVVRSMFRDIKADWYVLVDGDDTYPAEQVQGLLEFAQGGSDMVVGDRLSNGTYAKENKRGFHEFGNALVLFLINRLYHTKLCDIMSGYRVFSRRFVAMYPALSDGFQIETDMTIFALNRRFRIVEVPIEYRDRPAGSISKLNTYRDGARVILTIFNLYRFLHPLRYFSLIALGLFLSGVAVGLPVIIEFLETRYIAKVPSAILASGLMVLSLMTFSNALILDALNRSDQESFERQLKRLK